MRKAKKWKAESKSFSESEGHGELQAVVRVTQKTRKTVKATGRQYARGGGKTEKEMEKRRQREKGHQKICAIVKQRRIGERIRG